MTRSVLVLGAGVVGVSVAEHLRKRGYDVVLVDRQGPGEGASFGNGGLIQREAAFPHAFPRAASELLRIAGNRATDVSYHPLALPGLASPLLRYWWHSAPTRYARVVQGYSRLIATCIDEHLALAGEAGALALLRPTGYLRLFGDPNELDQATAAAALGRRDHGVNFATLDGDALAAAEPALLVRRAGAIHWTDPLAVTDPHALTLAYARLFTDAGGRFVHGDASTLRRAGTGWQVQTADGAVEASEAVVALGAASNRVTKPLGYAPPLFGKRGYHKHYGLRGNAVLNRPIIDEGAGFGLMPMRAGVRLTTGAEFTRPDAASSPVQLERAEPAARKLLPFTEAVEDEAWMGVRPCTPDMLPIIGPVPHQAGLWAAFGHGHQGLTLGPTTGRLLAEMMSGESPFTDVAPYAPERF